ncbi:MAG: tetratricopeptide repeat protein [Helicobacteraceae bacterium]|jgi:tetratricopeptide (TPR) repeat protein|nr:tetratricopeptide repeat protein [Helicobacteraceae bacterium]
MDAKFIAIVEQLVKEQGADMLINATKCKAHLADYAQNEFKKERHLLLIAIEAGAAQAIATANDLALCKQQQIRYLKVDRFIDENAATEAVDLLAFVLRGDSQSISANSQSQYSAPPLKYNKPQYPSSSQSAYDDYDLPPEDSQPQYNSRQQSSNYVAQPSVYSKIKIFDFEGRIGRLRYFAFATFFWTIYLFGILVLALQSQNLAGGLIGLAVCFYGAYIIWYLSFIVRRLHDFDNKGLITIAYVFLIILSAPILSGLQTYNPAKPNGIGIFVLIVFISEIRMYFKSGTKGTNKYGAPPQPNTARSFIASILALCFAAAFTTYAINAINVRLGASAVFNDGKSAFERGDFRQALINFDELIKTYPNNAEAYYNRGLAYYNLGDHKKAIADYDRAIKIDPKYANAYVNRGLAYYNLGEYKKALADSNRAIKIDPNLAMAYNNRAAAYIDLGEYKKALADSNRALTIDPNLALAYVNRGLAYINLGEYKKAIADYDRTIKIDPNFAMAYNNRGYAYYNLDDYKKAIADYTQAIKIDANLAIAYNNRSVAYRELGDYKNATKDARKACALGDCELLEYMKQEKLLRD